MKNFKEHIFDRFSEDGKYFEEAFNQMMKTAQTNRMIVTHEQEIGPDNLFGNIDKVISFLELLKREGYTEIEEKWCGYEDNYFVASKQEEETDGEYYLRLAKITNTCAANIDKREELKKKRLEKIKKLEEELRKLKG